MPGNLHEMLVEMFRERPALAAELLTGPLEMVVPAFEQAVLSPTDLTDVAPTEYRADAVVTLTTATGPVLAVVVEAQLQPDRRKRRTWPVYVATVHAQTGCPVVLLVVCPDRKVATWCARPVVVGKPRYVLQPVVLGPAQVPVLTDVAQARDSPELAVFSAVAHGGRPGRVGVLEALLAGLAVLDRDHASLYADVVLAVLPAAARDQLEALMTSTAYEYQSDYARRYFNRGRTEGLDQGRTEGKAIGEATAVLAVLDARGIEVPDEVREDITGCTDLDQLYTWVRRAATASKVHDLFD